MQSPYSWEGEESDGKMTYDLRETREGIINLHTGDLTTPATIPDTVALIVRQRGGPANRRGTPLGVPIGIRLPPTYLQTCLVGLSGDGTAAAAAARSQGQRSGFCKAALSRCISKNDTRSIGAQSVVSSVIPTAGGWGGVCGDPMSARLSSAHGIVSPCQYF